jgi:hypothetical protein
MKRTRTLRDAVRFTHSWVRVPRCTKCSILIINFTPHKTLLEHQDKETLEELDIQNILDMEETFS